MRLASASLPDYDLIRNGVRNVSNRTDGVRPVLTLRDPFPQTAITGLPGYFGLDTNARTPYVQQWDAGFQRVCDIKVEIKPRGVPPSSLRTGR